jgi:hypothetical protein
MQVSALNLIIAAQQARTATPPARPAEAKPNSPPQATSAEFAPLSFKPQTAEPAQDAPARYNAAAPLGSQIDIRV